MNGNYIVGKYYSCKGFYHRCAYPDCDDPYFFGRKNKKYHPDCKSRMDAERYAAKREKTSAENKIVERNLNILEEFYSRSNGNTKIPAMELRLKGFDFKAPSRRIKTQQYGYDCHIVHGYAFRSIREDDTLIIYKKDELLRI